MGVINLLAKSRARRVQTADDIKGASAAEESGERFTTAGGERLAEIEKTNRLLSGLGEAIIGNQKG